MTVTVHVTALEASCVDGKQQVVIGYPDVLAVCGQSCHQPLLTGLSATVAAAAVAHDTTDGDVVETDPWHTAETKDSSNISWTDLRLRGKLYRVLVQWLGKIIALLALLYFFICSLDLLGSAFRLLGGKAAGAAFSDSALLQNPIAGLMIGVLATVLLQSSSTSTSIVVTMVASGLLKVEPAIPIVMGANIGTSVTNTIVSLAQSSNRDEFRRAFAGATVHDMFNWLTVFILLPLEMASGYLYHLTCVIVSHCSLTAGFSTGNKDMLQTITKPFTELIVQLDKKVIEAIATGDETYAEKSLLKEWCGYSVSIVERNVTSVLNITSDDLDSTWSLVNVTDERNVTESIPVKECVYIFYKSGLSDMAVGGILLVFSLLLLCGSLILMVKILNSALRGSVLTTVKRTVNAELPGYAAYFTGYIVMVIGALMTMLVQSSSVFTSVLTPLVGVGVVTIERMYPLTLGSNMGTTTTGILAALAAPADQISPALQIALCHMFFNLSGIILFYPIPCLRLPIKLAKLMGDTTAQYRWFAIFYVIFMFFAAPLLVFALSMAGSVVLIVVVSILLFVASNIIIINVIQRRKPHWLPIKLRTWSFLPLWMHSLEPADRLVQKATSYLSKFCCCCRRHGDKVPEVIPDKEMQPMMINPVAEKTNSSNETLDIEEVEDLTREALTRISADDTESGYWSVAPSRIQSYAQLSQAAVNIDTESAAAINSRLSSSISGTPAPSRLPSFARIPFDIIVEMDAVHSEDDVVEPVTCHQTSTVTPR